MTLLDISDYTLDLPDGTRLLDRVSLSVAVGETVGLVGESGSGKSLTARSVIGVIGRLSCSGCQRAPSSNDTYTPRSVPA